MENHNWKGSWLCLLCVIEHKFQLIRVCFSMCNKFVFRSLMLGTSRLTLNKGQKRYVECGLSFLTGMLECSSLYNFVGDSIQNCQVLFQYNSRLLEGPIPLLLGSRKVSNTSKCPDARERLNLIPYNTTTGLKIGDTKSKVRCPWGIELLHPCIYAWPSPASKRHSSIRLKETTRISASNKR